MILHIACKRGEIELVKYLILLNEFDAHDISNNHLYLCNIFT